MVTILSIIIELITTYRVPNIFLMVWRNVLVIRELGQVRKDSVPCE